MSEPQSIGALVARAARLYARRFWFYAIATIVAVCAEAAIYFAHFLSGPVALFVAQALVLPVLVLIVYVRVALDATGAEAAPRQFWDRVLERSWAIIVIDFVATLVMIFAIPRSDDIGALALSVCLLIAAALLTFADTFAALEPEVSPLMLLPSAFAKGLRVGGSRVGYPRAMIAVFIQIAAGWGADAILVAAQTQHVANPMFWAYVPLGAAIVAPTSALVAVFYLDCLLRERIATGA